LRVEIHLTEQQLRFLDSPAPYVGFVGGRGSGKTWVGALRIIMRAMESPGLYAVYAPTYPMLRDSSWRALLEHGRFLKCVKGINHSEMRLTLGSGSELICRSVDDPERARGPNLSGAWLDEASLMSDRVFPIVIASLRSKGQQGWLAATFTPKGKTHWTFTTFGTEPSGVELIRARTADNPFLPPGFEQRVREQYPAHFAQQELEGKFIDPPGAVFRREWFKVVERVPEGLGWVRYWDLAASTKQTADYTASVAIAMGSDGTVYLRDMIRGRWEWPDQERIMMQTMLAEPRTRHGVEKALHGIAAVQALLRRRELVGIDVRGIAVEGDKLSRSLALAARAEQGKVALVRGSWIPAFLDELSAFTGDGSTHDDQVDSASGGLRMLMQPVEAQFAPSLWE